MAVVFYKDANGNFVEIPVSGVSTSQVQEAVNTYLSENPVNITETDPTVPDWAKQPNKPTYTADEVGTYSQEYIDEVASIKDEQIELAVESYLQEFPGYLIPSINIDQLDSWLNSGIYRIDSDSEAGITHRNATVIVSTSSSGSTQLLITRLGMKNLYVRYTPMYSHTWTDWEPIEPTYSKGTIDYKLDTKADKETSCTKTEVDNLIETNTEEIVQYIDDGYVTIYQMIESNSAKIGDIDSALDELHNYAQALIGGASE